MIRGTKTERVRYECCFPTCTHRWQLPFSDFVSGTMIVECAACGTIQRCDFPVVASVVAEDELEPTISRELGIFLATCCNTDKDK